MITDQLTVRLGSDKDSKFREVRNTPTGGHFATHGHTYIAFGDNDRNIGTAGPVIIDFYDPVYAFGINVTDWGDQPQAGALTLTTDAGHELVIAANPPELASGGQLFFGVIDQAQPFTQAILTSTTIYDGLGVDEVYFAEVPEPATLALLAAGGLLLVRRRGQP